MVVVDRNGLRLTHHVLGRADTVLNIPQIVFDAG